MLRHNYQPVPGTFSGRGQRRLAFVCGAVLAVATGFGIAAWQTSEGDGGSSHLLLSPQQAAAGYQPHAQAAAGNQSGASAPVFSGTRPDAITVVPSEQPAVYLVYSTEQAQAIEQAIDHANEFRAANGEAALQDTVRVVRSADEVAAAKASIADRNAGLAEMGLLVIQIIDLTQPAAEDAVAPVSQSDFYSAPQFEPRLLRSTVVDFA